MKSYFNIIDYCSIATLFAGEERLILECSDVEIPQNEDDDEPVVESTLKTAATSQTEAIPSKKTSKKNIKVRLTAENSESL